MLKKIYIITIISIIWFFGNNCFALIQVSDGIFPSDNTNITKIINTWNLWNVQQVKNNISNWKINTWSIWTGSTKPNKILVSTLGSWLSADIDFVQWLKWMYENWLTNYNEVDTYRPYDKVTREEMAKVISKLYDTEWLNLDNSNTCTFKDNNKFSSEMSPYIYKICSLWIMKWSSWIFSPWKTLTRAQWLTTIIRLFEEKNLDESQNPRYTSYYNRWLELWFIPSSIKLKDMDIWLSRYRLAKLIYSFHIKNNFRWGKSTVANEVIYDNFIDIIPDSIFETDDKSYIMKMHIKWWLLNTNWWEVLNAIIDNKTKLKLVKITSTNKNQDKSSFVRYSDVYDSEYNLIWSNTFIYSDNIIKEWYIRINNDKTVYKITPSGNDNSNIYDVIKKTYK